MICGVGCGGPPYAATDVVPELALGGAVAEVVAVVAGALASSGVAGMGGAPYGWTCAGDPHATVAIAKSAARDVRAIGDAVVSLASAPQNGHASPARTWRWHEGHGASVDMRGDYPK